MRHIRNEYLDNWITSVRSRFGLQIISHRNPFFSCVKKIKEGYFVGIAMDQNMPANAIFTPFLGRMAATTPLTALLSLKTQTPIFPARITRNDKNEITVTIENPIIPDKNYSEENLYKLVEKLNQKLEGWIKQNPELWLWAHNRWKREKDAPPNKEQVK
jgi:KDO2-lipid IV(A) lauroyltransferase